MPKKCVVPRCKSGYKTCKEKVSLFRVPNNETLLQQWQVAIGRKDRIISRKDHVCEKHFQEDDIIRYWIYRDIKDKLKTPRLKKNAVPSIFPQSNTSTENTNIPDTEKQEKQKKPRKKTKKQVLLDAEVEYYETVEILQETDLFNKLWNNDIILTVPSCSWALHKVEDSDSRVIIVSDVIVTNGVPCYQKQIVMNDDHSVSIIVGESIISQQDQIKYFGNPVELLTLDDLNILINTVHLLNLNPDINETTDCDDCVWGFCATKDACHETIS